MPCSIICMNVRHSLRLSSQYEQGQSSLVSLGCDTGFPFLEQCHLQSVRAFGVRANLRRLAPNAPIIQSHQELTPPLPAIFCAPRLVKCLRGNDVALLRGLTHGAHKIKLRPVRKVGRHVYPMAL